MNLAVYNGLQQRATNLENDLKNFILNALQKSDGRITYQSPKIDDPDLLFEDMYPIISTLWGKHGTYNVAITAVYLVKYDGGHLEIYADGIEQEFEEPRKEFLIYPEHFSDIAYFIMYPLLSEIKEYAQRLSLKRLVDKYGKLPNNLIDDSQSIISEFSKEYNDAIQVNIKALHNLVEQCYQGEYDRDEIKNKISELATDLAGLALIESHQKLMADLCIEEEDCMTYKEDVQDEFNKLFDEIENELAALIGFDLHNPEEVEITGESIEFNGKSYPIRTLCVDGTLDGCVIGTEELLTQIITTDGDYTSIEAEQIDLKILFYVQYTSLETV